jgi:pimeloyl-ACP methyl ester carboxylesterase
MQLATTTYGDEGSPVLMLHGLFGSARNWMTVGRRLAAAPHRVIAADLRNHGSSPWTSTMSYDQMASDVRDTVVGLGLGPVAMIGHSMGGKAAMLTALRFPLLVDRLVVADVAPVPYPAAFGDYVRAMRNARLTGVRRRAEVDGQLRDAVPEAGIRAFLLQNLVIDEPRVWWRPNLQVIEHALTDISGWPDVTGSYDGPALFVFGGKSDYVRPHHHDTIMRLFPRATYTEIPEAGHWVHAERMEEFLAAVMPFLGR